MFEIVKIHLVTDIIGIFNAKTVFNYSFIKVSGTHIKTVGGENLLLNSIYILEKNSHIGK